eukprot:scaffold1857_cov247-Pinguiococcus_pyrenoidosus.AAC.1
MFPAPQRFDVAEAARIVVHPLHGGPSAATWFHASRGSLRPRLAAIRSAGASPASTSLLQQT